KLLIPPSAWAVTASTEIIGPSLAFLPSGWRRRFKRLINAVTALTVLQHYLIMGLFVQDFHAQALEKPTHSGTPFFQRDEIVMWQTNKLSATKNWNNNVGATIDII